MSQPDGMLCVPSEYRLWRDGVTCDDTRASDITQPHGGQGTLCLKRPIWIDQKATALTTQAQQLRCVFLDEAFQQQVVWLDRAELASPRTLVRLLVARGFIALETDGLVLSRYLTAWLTENAETIQRVALVDRLGHVRIDDQDVFVLPDCAIDRTGTHTRVLTNAQHSCPGLRTRGSMDEWEAYITRALKYPIVQVAVAATFTAPLLPLIGEAGMAVYFWGEAKTGKSASQILAASAFSAPRDGLVITLDATQVGVGSRFETVSGLPTTLDEFEEASIDPAKLIYKIASGTGRTRSARDGTPQAPRSFDVVVLTSGEREIADYAKTGNGVAGGARERMLSVRVTERVEEAGDWRRQAGAHYGHAGRKFLSSMLAMDVDHRAAFLAVAEGIKATLPKGTPVTRAKIVGAIAYAGSLANQILGIPLCQDPVAWGVNLAQAVASGDLLASESLAKPWERALVAIQEAIFARQQAVHGLTYGNAQNVPSIGYALDHEIGLVTKAADDILKATNIPTKRAWAELEERGYVSQPVQRRTPIGRLYFRVFDRHKLLPNDFSPQPPQLPPDDGETIPGSLPFVMPDLGEGPNHGAQTQKTHRPEVLS